MSADGKRNAKPVGKRKVTDKSSPNYGKTYWESRPNRSDKVTNKIKSEKIPLSKKISKLKSLAKKGKAI